MRSFKKAVIGILSIIVLVLVFKALFIRTVYYDIGGIKIPSKYNAFTGKVTPILNYTGKPLKQTVKDTNIHNIGLSSEQSTLAQFRWAIFEQWVSLHPEFKGWDSNPEIFKKANGAFRKEMDAGTFRVRVIK